MNYLDLLKLAAPETLVVLTAFVVLAADLIALRGLEVRFRFLIGALISTVGCVGTIAWILVLPKEQNLLEGIFVGTAMIHLVKVALVALTVFTILISVERNFSMHAGEYFALLLLALSGTMFLVSSEDILMIFISLELLSLSLYVLTAFNKHNKLSAEAALKYFLFGGMSAAFTLFGLSLLYGLSGATNLGRIAAAIQGPKLDPLLVVAIVMTVIGFGFKVAAAPFHLWAPDAYQGAPIPSAALIASASKVAGFFIFAKIMTLGFAGAEGNAAWRQYAQGWAPVLALVAAASMVLGNLVAIVQSSVRRLLAYSAIAHAGYMLLAIIAHAGNSLASLLYYVITYALTTLGAFGVVGVVQEWTGGDNLSDFAGLSRRAPLLSLCMMIFMLSLAGIPPLAGFFGKFFLFSAALNTAPRSLGLTWLVAFALGMSAVSLYYYLQVLKQIFVSPEPIPGAQVRTPVVTQVTLALLALAVLWLGCAPGWLLQVLDRAMHQAAI
jgi:NADH-quinone oxidoreductase subunit N